MNLTVLAAALLLAGAALIGLGRVLRRRDATAELNALLGSATSLSDTAIEHAVQEHERRFFEPGVALASAVLDRFSLTERVEAELLRARVPLRPGEFVLGGLAAATAGGVLIGLLTGQALVAAIAWVGLLWGAWGLVLARSARRRKAFEQQLPEALTLIASSLEAGHTFLRAVEMMVEESAPPMAEEFERVLTEVQLGDPAVDALQRMADRLKIGDLSWVVQAIRIQQTVGGKLADLLLTLADFMRAREEVRREVAVLTAEGRLSARILGLLPVAVFLVIRTVNPEYVEPLLHGSGLVWLIGAGVSVITGILVIKRMAKVDL